MDFHIIDKNDFDSLKHLFPGTDDKWNKYRNIRLNQLSDNKICVFCIIVDSKIIGEITACYDSTNSKRIYLEAFRIDKSYQGKGYGQALINYVIEYFTKKGYVEFTIGVEEDNSVAKHIYFKLGFVTPIAKGYGDEFDPCEYTVYLKTI